jgi:hypothetical protein
VQVTMALALSTVIFFLLIGLEIKREVIEGSLAGGAEGKPSGHSRDWRLCCVDVILFRAELGDSEALRGWPVPAATDMAFAVEPVPPSIYRVGIKAPYRTGRAGNSRPERRTASTTKRQQAPTS